MAVVDGGIVFPAPKLRAWTEQVFQKIGVSRDDAALLTDSMIEANLRGVDTHGITRMLCVYVKRMQVGVVNPKTELNVAAGAAVHGPHRLPEQHRPGRRRTSPCG